jgi:hypothetical protein
MIPNPGKATPFMIRRLKPLHRVKGSLPPQTREIKGVFKSDLL